MERQTEGDGSYDGRAIEWVIRVLLFLLTVTAVWTVFGDDIGQLIAPK
jgi:hypothetical protein